MTGALIFRWGAGIPGREAKGLEVFGRAIGRFEDYTKQGRVHGHKEYIAVTGRSGGFMIADGEVEELQKLLTESATLQLISQAEAIVQDFEVTVYAGGTDQAVQELIGNYAGSLSELGYL